MVHQLFSPSSTSNNKQKANTKTIYKFFILFFGNDQFLMVRSVSFLSFDEIIFNLNSKIISLSKSKNELFWDKLLSLKLLRDRRVV